ncbi:MAG: beta-agarase [Coraliomargaritaceae bacterium]
MNWKLVEGVQWRILLQIKPSVGTMNLLFKKELSLVPLLALSLSFPSNKTDGRTEAEVHLNIRHSVGGVSAFERSKHINAHTHLIEPDWVGEDALLDYLVTDLDVSFGRDNGTMIEYLRQASEDPERPGYVDPHFLKVAGQLHRKIIYGTHHAWRHSYDGKNDIMIGGQPHAFLPNVGDEKTDWDLGGADAIGEYMGRFLKEFYREDGESPKAGQSRPKLVEILNEPIYHFIDGKRGSGETAESLFQFHNDAAKAIRRFDKDVLIGGYTAAFPIFEERDFARWEERMKLFIDLSGEHMDFYSVHFYDFNNRGDRGRDDYKGSRLEATFDLMEQYSQIRLGEVKPFVVSEYGGRDHKLENRAWTALRDWHFLKAATPLLMSYLDRPHLILKSIPFITTKAEWGRRDGVPYNRRLLHQSKERPGQIGEDWIFTDLVLFYELWSDVRGTRVESETNNPDVLMKCYVDGANASVILSNLSRVEETVSLHFLDTLETEVESVEVKHLYRISDGPLLNVKKVKGAMDSFRLKPEASAILQYTFKQPISIDHTVEEVKYYATECNKPIEGGSPLGFVINEVETGTSGKAILRIGFGRDPEHVRRPVVHLNGRVLDVPENFSGSEQATRPSFFGLLEIPVPYDQVEVKNTISVEFPDSGGRVSSVTLKYFSYD